LIALYYSTLLLAEQDVVVYLHVYITRQPKPNYFCFVARCAEGKIGLGVLRYGKDVPNPKIPGGKMPHWWHWSVKTYVLSDPTANDLLIGRAFHPQP
jgi:hypothetical protein